MKEPRTILERQAEVIDVEATMMNLEKINLGQKNSTEGMNERREPMLDVGVWGWERRGSSGTEDSGSIVGAWQRKTNRLRGSGIYARKDKCKGRGYAGDDERYDGGLHLKKRQIAYDDGPANSGVL